VTTAAISIDNLGKMYKLCRRPADKVLDALGIAPLLFWRKNVYEEFWALRDLNLSIHGGERVGIIGRNGAGKSTLLKIIAGNVSPTEGCVRVAGSVQALMELGTGFHPEFTGRQNIRASLAYNGFSARRIRAKEEEIVEFAELEGFIDQPVKTYSAGMYARLGFSTATAIEPEVLIVDEVLGAGDAYFTAKCIERMKRLTEGAGATVLFVSHDLGSVQQMCERVVWIERGRIVQDGKPLDVTKAYYASILKQEEARLKARNARLGRRQADRLVADEVGGDHDLLLRLVTGHGGPPKHSHPIRRLRLSAGNPGGGAGAGGSAEAGFMLEVEPGTPMDNDPNQPARLLADATYMNWGPPTLLEGASGLRVRCFKDVGSGGGRYLHAPFVFTVPKDISAERELTFSIEHAAADGEQVFVEVFAQDRYHRLGELSTDGVGLRCQSWPVPASLVRQESSCAEPSSGTACGTGMPHGAGEDGHAMLEPVRSEHGRDRYRTGHAEFVSVATQTPHGDECVVFEAAAPIALHVVVDVRRRIARCEFTMAIYTPSGVVLAVMRWPVAGGLDRGRHEWRIIFTEPPLRQGEYVLSFAIIREWSDVSNEKLTYYCEWNRNVSFRIDEGLVGTASMGLVRMESLPKPGAEIQASPSVFTGSCERGTRHQALGTNAGCLTPRA
jgi:lipopolysaccharide transport system ATP-binding protein